MSLRMSTHEREAFLADVHVGISGPDFARVIEATLEGRARGPTTIRLQGLEYLPDPRAT